MKGRTTQQQQKINWNLSMKSILSVNGNTTNVLMVKYGK